MPSILLLRIAGAASIDGGASASANANLEITLEGCVTEKVVSACNAALEVLSKSVHSLKSGLPPLRFQGGQWEFVTSCNRAFHSTILSECFITPIARLQYRLENPTWELGKKQEKEIIGYSLVTTHTRVFVTDEDTQAYYPGGGALVGGKGQTVTMDPERSLDLLPDTTFNVANRDLLVFGVGWSPVRNKTYEMMMGNNRPPDIDLVIYLNNRWGEPLYKLSAKEMKALPTPAKVAEQLRFNHLRCYDSAVKVSGDSVTGAGAGDDERAAIFLPGLDVNICSILVTASIASNARDFNYVRNVYVRLLDVETHTAEIELCRFQLPDVQNPPDHKTAVLLRLDRVGGSTDFSQSVHPSDWEMRTVGGFCLSPDPARPEVMPGDIVSGVRYGTTEVSMKATAWSIGAAIQGGPYKFNIDRIEDAAQHCAPITMSFSRLVESGKNYEVTFEDNPTSQIQFSPQHLRSNRMSRIGLSTQEGIPMVQAVRPNWRPRLIPGQLAPYLGCWIDTPRPDRVVIHDLRAYIPASDVGGTTDAYCLVFYNKLQQSTSGQLVEAWPKEIARTPVQKKIACPAIVAFGDLAVEIPIDSMNGRVPKCIIEVRDKDWNPLGFMAGMGSKGAVVADAADDSLLKHKVNLTEFVCSDKTKTDEFAVQPDVVGEIMNHRSNAGFTKQMVTLLFKVTLLLPGETVAFPTTKPAVEKEDRPTK